MAERPRALGNFKGWVTFRLNFRLKGYVSRQNRWTVRWENGYTTTLPLEVFTRRNYFVADFIRLKLNFIYKQKQKIVFEPPFGGTYGVTYVRTPSIARNWKARGRLPIRHNWTFFAISYGWDIISRNRSKSAFFEGEWITLSANVRR